MAMTKEIATGKGPHLEPARMDSRQLHAVLREALAVWLGLDVRYFASRDEGGAEFPLETMLRYEDPASGVLVLRSTAGFRQVLREAVERRSPGASAGRDLFTEAVVRFYQKYIWGAYNRDCITLQPARIRSSRPGDWPHREPDASCLGIVGSCPVEVRSWTGNPS
jgi:hypothetical protein